MDTATKQIIRQLESSVSIIVRFTDAEPERIKLIEQDGDCWIKPLFCNPRRITKNLYDELASQFTGIKKFNTDPETIDSRMTYDDFMDKYYNDKTYTTADTAKELGVSVRRVQAMIKDKRLAATRFGRQWQITGKAIDVVRDRKPGCAGWKEARED